MLSAARVFSLELAIVEFLQEYKSSETKENLDKIVADLRFALMDDN